jgi:hypothetical protein
MSLKDKLAKLAEKVICGPDDDAALTEEIRKEREASKKEGNQ